MISEFSMIEIFSLQIRTAMTRNHKQCILCPVTSTTHSHLGFFQVTDHMKKYLNIKTRSKHYICENHFDANAFRPHGQTQF